jgi:hypothetical protein
MVERTRVATFVACDKVIEESKTKKKTVVGIFESLHMRQLPSRFGAPWYVFAQLHGVDPGSHVLTLNVVHDQTQGVVLAANVDIPDKHPENIDLVIPAQAVEFHKDGKYVATLNIDGEQSGYLVLNVVLQHQEIGEQ